LLIITLSFTGASFESVSGEKKAFLLCQLAEINSKTLK